MPCTLYHLTSSTPVRNIGTFTSNDMLVEAIDRLVCAFDFRATAEIRRPHRLPPWLRERWCRLKQMEDEEVAKRVAAREERRQRGRNGK